MSRRTDDYIATRADDHTSKRVAELEAALDAVRALHPAYDESDSPGDDFLAPGKWCPECGDEKPCKTRRVLRSAR